MGLLPISEPFVQCPDCGALSFGVTQRFPNHQARRCTACGRSGAEPLPPIRKSVLYLDQYVWSNLVHQADPSLDPAKHARTGEWQPVLAKVESLVAVEALVCPTSGFHTDESMPHVALPVMNAIQRLRSRFSTGATFPDDIEVQISELRWAARCWVDGILFDAAALPNVIEGELHGWCPSFGVVVAAGSVYGGIATDVTSDLSRRGGLLQDLFESWKSSPAPIRAEDQFATEVAGFGPALLQSAQDGSLKANMRLMAIAREIGADRTQEFLLSGYVTQIPSIRIPAAVYASVAHDASTGGMTAMRSSTFTDIGIVGTVAAYCDTITVDKPFGAVLSKPLPRQEIARYGTAVLAGRQALNDHLDQLAADLPDSHLDMVSRYKGQAVIDRFRADFDR